MDIDEAVQVLNSHKFLGFDQWFKNDGMVRRGVNRLSFLVVEDIAERLLSAEPCYRKPAEPVEPGVEECLAAINRATHRGSRGWKLFADGATDQKLNRDEILGLGKLLIERERAAKGGAGDE